jgi:hypothetical protein
MATATMPAMKHCPMCKPNPHTAMTPTRTAPLCPDTLCTQQPAVAKAAGDATQPIPIPQIAAEDPAVSPFKLRAALFKTPLLHAVSLHTILRV